MVGSIHHCNGSADGPWLSARWTFPPLRVERALLSRRQSPPLQGAQWSTALGFPGCPGGCPGPIQSIPSHQGNSQNFQGCSSRQNHSESRVSLLPMRFIGCSCNLRAVWHWMCCWFVYIYTHTSNILQLLLSWPVDVDYVGPIIVPSFIASHEIRNSLASGKENLLPMKQRPQRNQLKTEFQCKVWCVHTAGMCPNLY